MHGHGILCLVRLHQSLSKCTLEPPTSALLSVGSHSATAMLQSSGNPTHGSQPHSPHPWYHWSLCCNCAGLYHTWHYLPVQPLPELVPWRALPSPTPSWCSRWWSLYTTVPSSSAGVHPKRAPTPTSLTGHAHLQPAQRLEQQRRLPSGEKVGGVGRRPNSTCTPPLVNTMASTLLLAGFALDGARDGGLYSTLIAPSLAHAPPWVGTPCTHLALS
jgi:hypothetical protein